jgi:sucrose-phosphate synthase
MYIQLISVHGLIRGERIEMGRDSDTGGQVRYVVELAKTLSQFEQVEQVDLFTRQIRDRRVAPEYGEQIEPLSDKARIVRLPCGGGRYMRKERLWPYLDDYVDAMIWFTRKEGRTPTLVHGHYADAGYIAQHVAAAFAVPFVFTGHSLGRDKKAYLEEQGWSPEAMNKDYNIDHRIHVEESCLAAADLVVVSTSHEKESQYGRYDSGRDPHFEVIPPGTSLERFFPYYDYDLSNSQIEERFKQARVRMTSELERFHIHPEKPLILALCRPDKRKNINTLVQAYGEDKELQAVANLAVFAGIRKSIEDMPDEEQSVLTDILLMMDRYDLYGRLAIPKRHDSEVEVPELYRIAASKRGLFANTAYIEPFGLTFIESSAVGLPFVGTRNGGPQDIVANCDSGILVNVEDPKEIAQAMKLLLTDQEKWQQASANGINRVREHYSWDTHCNHYLDTIKELGMETETPKTFAIGQETTAPGKRMAELDCLLITDIDNTLLGDDEALARLVALLRARKDRIGVGIASGRYLEAAVEVLRSHGIENLDVAITSVGTEIYYGTDLKFDKGWASHLRVKWRPDRVREALTQLPFLSLQKDEKTQREFKISYDLDDSVPPDEALPAIYDALSKARCAHTLIFSHGTYVDVLPHRASKGKAVRYLSTKWNIPIERMVTAGDSGNDRDMLVGDTSGIVVGNYADELEDLKRSTHRVYFAKGHYAGGIIEGMQHFGFLDRGDAS